jgi:hypothetical protein
MLLYTKLDEYYLHAVNVFVTSVFIATDPKASE